MMLTAFSILVFVAVPCALAALILVVGAVADLWHERREEQRMADEWRRQFARGLTSERFDAWKLSKQTQHTEPNAKR